MGDLETVDSLGRRRLKGARVDTLPAVLSAAGSDIQLMNQGLNQATNSGSMPFRVGRDALPDGRRGAERVIGKVLQA